MTAHELARALLALPDVPVLAWDPDADDACEVSGYTHGEGVIALETDSDEPMDDATRYALGSA